MDSKLEEAGLLEREKAREGLLFPDERTLCWEALLQDLLQLHDRESWRGNSLLEPACLFQRDDWDCQSCSRECVIQCSQTELPGLDIWIDKRQVCETGPVTFYTQFHIGYLLLVNPATIHHLPLKRLVHHRKRAPPQAGQS